MTGSGTRVSRLIVQRAEALLRSLIGVSRAEVCVRTTGGVERVRLVADGGLSNGQIVQNVRSALLAGLGVVLQPGQIEFVEEGSWIAASPSAAGVSTEGQGDAVMTHVSPPAKARAGDVAPPVPAVISSGNGHNGVASPAANGKAVTQGAGAPGTGKSARNGNENGNGHANGNGHGTTNGTATSNGGGATASGNGGAGDPAVPEEEVSRGESPAPWTRRVRSRPGPGPGSNGAPAARDRSPAGAQSSRSESTIGARVIRLEGVDLLRQGGRLRCRVVLSAGGDRYSAVADCTDEPLAELQLAARVTCDALRAADLTQTHFEAATVANLAGGMHVLVALSGWNRGEPVRRSGSAVIRESAEHAAALAVLHALANT